MSVIGYLNCNPISIHSLHLYSFCSKLKPTFHPGWINIRKTIPESERFSTGSKYTHFDSNHMKINEKS